MPRGKAKAQGDMHENRQGCAMEGDIAQLSISGSRNVPSLRCEKSVYTNGSLLRSLKCEYRHIQPWLSTLSALQS